MMWPYGIVFAGYVLSRMPLRTRFDLSPYTLVYRRAPNFKAMITPFAVVTVTVNDSQPGSMLPRAILGVFLGYHEASADYSYAFLNLETGKLGTSADVTPLEGSKVSRAAWKVMLGEAVEAQIVWKTFIPPEPMGEVIDEGPAKLNDITRTTDDGIELISDRKQMRSEMADEFERSCTGAVKRKNTASAKCSKEESDSEKSTTNTELRIEHTASEKCSTEKGESTKRAERKRKREQSEVEERGMKQAAERALRREKRGKREGNCLTLTGETRGERRRTMAERIRTLWSGFQPVVLNIEELSREADIRAIHQSKYGRMERVALSEEIGMNHGMHRYSEEGIYAEGEDRSSLHWGDSRAEVYLTENVLNFSQAMKLEEEKESFEHAMRDEWRDMRFVTRVLGDPVPMDSIPDGAEVIGMKWNMERKPEREGQARYKARLTARGDQESISEEESTYAPTATKEAERFVAAVSVKRRWKRRV